MRFLIPFLAAGPATAHTGHIADLGGHDHWVIGVGLGVIAGAAVAGWLKGKTDGEADPDDAPEAEGEEAPA